MNEKHKVAREARLANAYRRKQLLMSSLMYSVLSAGNPFARSNTACLLATRPYTKSTAWGNSSQTALQSLPSDPSHSLVIHANSLISALLSHKQLVILPGSKCWHVSFHISVLSASGGANLHDVLAVAVKSAIWDLRIPRTRRIEFVKPAGQAGDTADDGQDAGMKSLLKGRKGKTDAEKIAKGAADFELVDYEADAGEPLQGREHFPLSIALNLVRNYRRICLFTLTALCSRLDSEDKSTFLGCNPLRELLQSHTANLLHRRTRQCQRCSARDS